MLFLHFSCLAESHAAMRPLNSAIAELVEEYSMVAFTPLDVTDEDSVEKVLSIVDTAMQYGEDTEPRDLLPEEGGMDALDGGDNF